MQKRTQTDSSFFKMRKQLPISRNDWKTSEFNELMDKMSFKWAIKYSNVPTMLDDTFKTHKFIEPTNCAIFKERKL